MFITSKPVLMHASSPKRRTTPETPESTRANGKDLRQLPLVERKEHLPRLIERSDVICAKFIEERGRGLFKEICQRDLEGIISKRINSIYSGSGRAWLKVKNPNYSQAEGRHEMFTTFRERIQSLR